MPVNPVITPSQTPPDHLAIHITSIEAALLRLNIDIPIEDLIVVMREEELRLEAEKTERYISLSKVVPVTRPKAAPGQGIETIPKPTEPAYTNQFNKEHCRSLPKPKEAFPPNSMAQSWFPPIDTNRYTLSKRALFTAAPCRCQVEAHPSRHSPPGPQAPSLLTSSTKDAQIAAALIKQYNEAAFPNRVSTPTL